MTVLDVVTADAADVRLARRATGLLRSFNEAGVLSAADVHVAQRLGALAGEAEDVVLLGAALAVRAPRMAHVCSDLATIRHTATSELDEAGDLQALPWPDVTGWMARLATSPLVAVGDGGPHDRPLRLEGTRLYLDRYWREERRLAADLLDRSQAPVPHIVDAALLASGLERLFPGSEPDLQRQASAAVVTCRFAVVAGGPGNREDDDGRPHPRPARRAGGG